MNHRPKSIDGFRPRRSGSQIGERHLRQPGRPAPKTPPPRGLTRVEAAATAATNTDRPGRPEATGLAPSKSGGLVRRDISESLSGVDSLDQPAEPPKKRRLFGRSKQRRKHDKSKVKSKSKKRRIIKWLAIVLLIAALAAGGWLAYKAITASNSIFQGNILGLIQNQPLQEDDNGRSNILVLGTSDNNPDHPGGYLTDSMMIVSIDQDSGSAAMFSVPRDLYVDYGMACNSGYQGKINEYFNCVNSDWDSPQAQEERMRETRGFIGDIFGMDLQYAVHVNHTVVQDAVDAVGGINVDIQGSNDAPGILDRNFDWRCDYECYLVRYDNGVHHLDGTDALFLAQARGAGSPTYGLSNSNFDREQNQQKILIALQEKAASSGTLTDIGKVTGLMDAFGNNLRTNFETSEVRTLADLGMDIEVDSIERIDLYDEDNPLVESGNYGGASVVMPVAGIFNYSQLQAFLQQKLSSDPVTREGAGLAVLNGTNLAGLADREADKLTEAGFVISNIANAPASDYAGVEIYQTGQDNPQTKQALESRFGVTIQTAQPPVAVAQDIGFVVIFGQDNSSS